MHREICSNCRRGNCTLGIGPNNLAVIECPDCDGSGCDECGETGQVTIDQCALDYTRGLGQLANLATYAEKGMLPLPGPLLDQPAWFVAFWHFLQSQLTKIENEKLERVSRR